MSLLLAWEREFSLSALCVNEIACAASGVRILLSIDHNNGEVAKAMMDHQETLK